MQEIAATYSSLSHAQQQLYFLLHFSFTHTADGQPLFPSPMPPLSHSHAEIKRQYIMLFLNHLASLDSSSIACIHSQPYLLSFPTHNQQDPSSKPS
jgi:hypothetical protein